MGSRCVYYGKSLLESGTLGTKGNTQVVVPHLTQSYGETKDPEPEGTAKCLLHSFPSNIDMCLQWARELIFEGEFVSYIEAFNTYLKKEDYVSSMETLQLRKTLNNFRKILPLPSSFDECVVWARTQFQQYFNHDPQQLLHNYPLDHKDKNGTPFWTGTRRPPIALEFDPNNEAHSNFVVCATFLRAYTAGVIESELKPSDLEEKRKHILQVASKVNFPPFKPASVKIATNEEEEKENESKEGPGDEEKDLLLQLVPPRSGQKPLTPCDFEKDDDRNFHIDFIHATANLKAAAYGIKQVSRLQAKLIAGRIVPAIVTTTAVVSGLVIFELYKLLRKETTIEQFRNAFLNLAVDTFQISEPLPPTTYKWKGEKKSTWDAVHFKEGDLTVRELVKKLSEKYKITPFLINYVLPDNHTKIIYQDFPATEEEQMEKKVSELVAKYKKGGLAPSDRCFPLQVIPDTDDEVGEDDVFPPLWYYFK